MRIDRYKFEIELARQEYNYGNLAEAVGIARDSLSRTMTKTVSHKMLCKIAAVLKCEPEYLLADETQVSTKPAGKRKVLKISNTKLKKAIAENGFSNILKFTQAIGVSDKTIYAANYRGGINPKLLGKMAKALGCRPEDLLEGEKKDDEPTIP